MSEHQNLSGNKFFQEVIDEEDAINKEAGDIRKRVFELKEEIASLEKSDVFYGRRRKYCKFSNGYDCDFPGDCTHKKSENKIFDLVLDRPKCLAEEHARSAIRS